MARGRPLYLRLYFWFLAVLLVVSLVAGAILASFAPRWQMAWHAAIGRGVTHLSGLLARDIDDPQATRATVQHLADTLGLDLTVVTPDGKVLASWGAPVPMPDGPTLQRMRGEIVQMRGRLPVWGGPIVAGARGTRAIALVRPQRSWDGWSPLRPLLTLAGVLLVTLALVYPLSRSITRPLEQLASAAEKFGRGDLSARSGLGAGLGDEVGRLAKSFDEMAERIASARRAEKELLANVSHELRTPLARIRVALELIETDDDPTRKRLANVTEDLGELDALVTDVLTASRLDLAALPLRKQPVRLRALAERCRARIVELEPARSVEIDVPDELVLHADEALLRRVLDNLLDNGRKYDPSQKPLRVEARAEPDTVRIAVIDQGPGIPEAELERVFDPFFRGDHARSSSSGWGLGLALARRIVEAHGGTIRAQGGPGTRIEITLPTG